MKKSKEYIKNTIILLLGKFSTQFMSFFLIPLYTHYLDANDYGSIDLIQTYITLVIPVVLLCIDSAVFRFLVDERNNEEEIKRTITSSISKTLKQVIIFSLIFLIFNFFVKVKYVYFVVINVISVMFSNVLLQISRGLGKNKNYSIACIITGASILIVNIILIIGFKFNASSILISNSIGSLLCIIYLFISVKIYKYIDFKYANKKKTKELLSYSIPLIPNALSWWIVNVSDRTLISFFINAAANGIYTVACKFSNILNGIFGIFSMSWQETATMHIEDNDRDSFFTEMINAIFNIFVCVSTLILGILPFAFNIIVGSEYASAYNYIPILLLANSIHVLIGLLGGVYIAKKMTKKVTSTTIISAIINLIVNILLIKKIGLYAACFSTLIAYFVMMIYRLCDVQKYVKVRLKASSIIGTITAFLLAFISYYNKILLLNILTLGLLVLYAIFCNKKIIIELLNSLKFKIAKLLKNNKL